ncbi:MAG: AMP-binding protein, partial [bacterium]|nr:AMP-binding protein [bacterium]
RQSKEGEKFLCAYYVESKSIQPASAPPRRDEPRVRPSTQQQEPNLKDYLAQFLPGYMIPSFLINLEKIPLTPNGKIDRKALEEVQISTLKTQTHQTPRNEIERKLTEIWAGLLEATKETIRIDDNFFDIGGHSLRATVMVSKIHKAFNVKLPLAEIFRNQSVRKIAAIIKEYKQEKYSNLQPVEKKEYHALSSAQKRMYFLQQMDLNSTAYNMPVILPVTPNNQSQVPNNPLFPNNQSPLENLQDVFKKLIRRHESLRTSFEQLGEVPIQRIHDTVDFAIVYYDLTSHSQSSAGTKTVEGIVKDFLKPFDLSRAPLIRVGLIKQVDEVGGNFLLLVDMHHIVSDGTSHTILADDFFALLNNKTLKPLRLQYKDFSHWQNKVMESGEIKTREAFWLDLYRGEIPRLEMLTDYKRPDVFSFAGRAYQLNLEPEDTASFRELAADSGGTLYMNILAVLNILFHKYTGQTDIVIGSGIAGRPHADLQQIVGMFVNTLAMRNYPQEDKKFHTFLSEVINRSIQAFENQDIQFEELVDKLDPPRDPSRNPLFDISMVVQNFRGPEKSALPEIKDETTAPHSPLELENRTSKFDITFFITETAETIQLDIEYYADIFKHTTIERLATHFKNSVKAVIHNPEVKLDDIVILSEKEKHQLLYEFNDTAREYPAEKTLRQLFAEQVERTPDSIAAAGLNPAHSEHFTSSPITYLTYRQLNREANRIAFYLHNKKGIKPGDRVGVLMSQSMNRLPAILGILKAGAVYIPLAPDLPQERIRFMINDAGIGIVFSEKNQLRKLNRLQWECDTFESYLCMDSYNIHSEEENEKSELMDVELWHNVGETATDEITGGGWVSSYTGEPFSQKEMDEYGENVLTKLKPLLHKKMRVLEIGCASGITMFRIAPEVGEYYGTDLSKVIIEKNKERVQRENHQNIKLFCLAAHEIDQIETDISAGFDLIIINSVIQCFPGHNHLRNVIRKAVSLLGDKAHIFVGDVMDQQLKHKLENELTTFKYAHRDNDYTTKTDLSAELFVHKGFWQNLRVESRAIATVTLSPKIHTIKNELTKFRYDVLITTDNTNTLLQSDNGSPGDVKNPPVASMPPLPSLPSPLPPETFIMKHQEDLRDLAHSETDNIRERSTVVPSTSPAYIIYTSGTTGT